MQFSNTVTTLLGIKYPILSAPMANVAGAELACAVTRAGGLGLIGGGYCNEQWLRQELAKATANEFGIGFVTWKLEQNPNILELALESKPRAIMLSFGDISAVAPQIKAAAIPLICQVQTKAQAFHAIAHGADLIVAQGSEAGGHAGNRGTLALVPAIVDVAGSTPVIAAGGIADGRGMAASIMLGAQGVLMGTRFYAAKESLGTAAAKELLVEAEGDNTVKTNLFDLARGMDWPESLQESSRGRALRNTFFELWKHQQNLSEKITPEIQALYQQAVTQEDYNTAAIFAGEAVDFITEVLSAQAIVERTASECLRLLTLKKERF